jgi:uncharacterized FAD-dependent dehydrogenase
VTVMASAAAPFQMMWFPLLALAVALAVVPDKVVASRISTISTFVAPSVLSRHRRGRNTCSVSENTITLMRGRGLLNISTLCQDRTASSSLSPSSSFRPFPFSSLQAVSSSVSTNNADADVSNENHNKKRRPKRRRPNNNATTKKRGGGIDGPSLSSGGEQTWRIFDVNVHPDELSSEDISIAEKASALKFKERNTEDYGKIYLTPTVMAALCQRLKLTPDGNHKESGNMIVSSNNVKVVRRSLDARKNRKQRDSSSSSSTGNSEPLYNYVMDVTFQNPFKSKLRLKHQPGRMERITHTASSTRKGNSNNEQQQHDETTKMSSDDHDDSPTPKLTPKRVVIVGAGPAGLFCALQLIQQSNGQVVPIVVERGKAVEQRGRDIGSLIHRKKMNSESNFAFGEGGAGTWSDGKLTTRIGRNSEGVRHVLETFVKYGAPSKILVEGSPHLGTDNLVRLLRNMRHDLTAKGGEILFGARMAKLHHASTGATTGTEDGDVKVTGIDVCYDDDSRTETIHADAVVLATGHSARDVYQELHDSNKNFDVNTDTNTTTLVQLEPKGFAVGFRVEHPQSLINQIQYGSPWASRVFSGKKRTDQINLERCVAGADTDTSINNNEVENEIIIKNAKTGRLPVASYRLATNQAHDGTTDQVPSDNNESEQPQQQPHYRGVYSFCMCPGGQIVPASTDPNEVCVNGMSFSQRDSTWANSALVVTVDPTDPILLSYRQQYGPIMAGVEFQRDMERRASIMGGGNGDLTVPVQRLTDYLEGTVSVSSSDNSLPSSSYRLGVKSAPLHELYPPPLTHALRQALLNKFDKQMPGYVSSEALLHGVETRTSSPLRICRDPDTLQSIGSLSGLYPAGEGAGFAGGIVSAAVDGSTVGQAVLDHFLMSADEEQIMSGVDSGSSSSRMAGSSKKTRSKSVGFTY